MNFTEVIKSNNGIHLIFSQHFSVFNRFVPFFIIFCFILLMVFPLNVVYFFYSFSSIFLDIANYFLSGVLVF